VSAPPIATRCCHGRGVRDAVAARQMHAPGPHHPEGLAEANDKHEVYAKALRECHRGGHRCLHAGIVIGASHSGAHVMWVAHMQGVESSCIST
jgi:hypothetical protein